MAPASVPRPAIWDANGNGTDQYWKDFVTAIVTHSKNNRGIHIKYWELWNEPSLPRMWSGTIPQLLRMARDAKEIIHGIDPDAVFLTPPAGLQAPRHREFMEDWLTAGGGQYADGISFHGYVHAPAPATDFIKYYADFVKSLPNMDKSPSLQSIPRLVGETHQILGMKTCSLPSLRSSIWCIGP